MNILSLIGRNAELFGDDITSCADEIREAISGARILVIGGGGSIGQAVTIELFKRDPRLLHVVDISENNLVELVRDIRSSIGYSSGEFKTFAVDCGSREFSALVAHHGPYDYVFNLSALKHVRSEKDPYTLMRMVQTNVNNTLSTLRLTWTNDSQKYFCVSTDKAANPVNMMGASKRIMELFLMRESLNCNLSMARFANVAFSDGSLLHGFNQRISKGHPIAAPRDVKRYFVTPKESGELCMMSGLFGSNRDIFFPKLSQNLHLVSFADIALNYLGQLGMEADVCETEAEARKKAAELRRASEKTSSWPCYFFDSDTTGEKDFEEFYTDSETLDFERYASIGVIENSPDFNGDELDAFSSSIMDLYDRGAWSKVEILSLFRNLLPDFSHDELGRNLDQKM